MSCPFCASALGTYTDPNRRVRCLNCYQDIAPAQPTAEEAATVEPNADVDEAERRRVQGPDVGVHYPGDATHKAAGISRRY